MSLSYTIRICQRFAMIVDTLNVEKSRQRFNIFNIRGFGR